MNFNFNFTYSANKIKPPPPIPFQGKKVRSWCSKTERIHFDADKNLHFAVAGKILNSPPSNPNSFFNKRVIFYTSIHDGVSTTYKINKNSFIKRLGIDSNQIEKGKIYNEQSMQALISQSQHNFKVTNSIAPGLEALNNDIINIPSVPNVRNGLSAPNLNDEPDAPDMSHQPDAASDGNLDVNNELDVPTLNNELNVPTLNDEPEILGVNDEPEILGVNDEPEILDVNDEPEILDINDENDNPTGIAGIIHYEKGKTKEVVPTSKDDFLGRGNFGAVYVHGNNPELVVKKAVLFNLENEFAVGKRINGHPLFVNTHNLYVKNYPEDSGYQPEPKQKIVMDRVRGESLTKFLSVTSKIDKEKTIATLESLKSGISFLYDKEVVWCDVNDGNILFTPDNHPKIIDYGMWVIEPDPEARTKGLLFGAMEAVGWIMRASFIRGNNQSLPNEKDLIFPNEFFIDNTNIPFQILPLDCVGNEEWVQNLQIEQLNSDEERKRLLVRYIDEVITKFREQQEPIGDQ